MDEKVMTTIIINGEEYTFEASEEQLHQLDLLKVECDWEDPDWYKKLIDNGKYDVCVNMLFTINRPDDAWKIIREHKENIDFVYIFNGLKDNPCPFFQLSREDVAVYKYLFETKQIDDRSYAYFQLICNDVSDIDFWETYFVTAYNDIHPENVTVITSHTQLSVNDKLDIINQSFNGNNPFEVGLIALTDKFYKLIFTDSAINGLLDDYIIGSKPGILFTGDMIRTFIDNNNLDPENIVKYMNIIYEFWSKDNEINDSDAKDTYDFWTYAWETIGDKISRMKFDTLDKLLSFIESEAIHTMNVSGFYHTIAEIIFNSLAFLNYPYVVKEKLEENKIELSYLYPEEFIHGENLPFILTYKLLPFINTDAIASYPFPAVYKCIYDGYDNVYMNGEIVTIEKAIKMLSDIEDAKSEICHYISDNTSSEYEYDEVISSLVDFRERISTAMDKETDF